MKTIADIRCGKRCELILKRPDLRKVLYKRNKHVFAGDSQVVELPLQHDNFEAGQRASCRLQLPPLGELQRLEVEMSGVKPESTWQLTSICVFDESNGAESNSLDRAA